MLVALGIGGPIAAIALSDSGDARSCSTGGAICREDANCCSRDCQEQGADRRRRCACEDGQVECGIHCCTAPDICLNGVCRNPTPTRTPTQTPTATSTATSTATVVPPTCKGGITLCNAVSTDTRTDSANCGACGNVCSGGQQCSCGVCATELTCRAFGELCTNNFQCCSVGCFNKCFCSEAGEPCYSTSDCCSNPVPQTCIGFVCVPN